MYLYIYIYISRDPGHDRPSKVWDLTNRANNHKHIYVYIIICMYV